MASGYLYIRGEIVKAERAYTRDADTIHVLPEPTPDRLHTYCTRSAGSEPVVAVMAG
jgi:hypothetical protein